MNESLKNEDTRSSLACDNARAGNDFVGLKYEDHKLNIFFPMGYRYTKNKDEFYFEKKRRNEILNLIAVLSSFGKKKQGSYSLESNEVKEENEFPIHSYMYVVVDFLNHGYYTEKDVFYKKSNSGKINWSRTIKHVNPNVCKNGIFYSEFITHQVNYSENELITKVHQWCVHESFIKIGFLFSSFIPQTSSVDFNKDLFKGIILAKIAETFNEKTLMLLQHMLNIVEYKDKSRNAKTEIFGTYEFEKVWEDMIENIYGTEDKTKFYPQGSWTTDQEYPDSELMPDSIMKTSKDDDRVFVLDSKYYQHGLHPTKNLGLPHTADMLKQVAYGEYVEHLGNDGSKVYNAFLMPSNANESTYEPKYIGFAKLKWKEPESKAQYRKIHGILLDTRWVMENCTVKHDEAIEKLAQIIEENKVK